jgi:hypothetical protein
VREKHQSLPLALSAKRLYDGGVQILSRSPGLAPGFSFLEHLFYRFARREMGFVKISNRIINLEQIAYLEVFDSSKRIKIQFSGVTEKLNVYAEEAEEVVDALEASDLMEARKKSAESFQDLMRMAEEGPGTAKQ